MSLSLVKQLYLLEYWGTFCSIVWLYVFWCAEKKFCDGELDLGEENEKRTEFTKQ